MNHQESPSGKVERDREDQLPLFAQQIRLLYRFSLVEYLATLLVTFILGAILWDDLTTRPTLFAWFVLISLVTIARYVAYKVFINTMPPDTAMARWEQMFLVGAFLTSALWAMIGTTLLPDAARMTQRLSVVMLVTLLLTGAVAYYAPHRFAYKVTAFVGLVCLLAK